MTRTPAPHEKPSPRLSQSIKCLIRLLREIDAETLEGPIRASKGLQWYRGASHQTTIRNSWLKELQLRLTQAGFPTQVNVPFPAPGKGRCGMMIDLEPGHPFWLEVIGIWKEYLMRVGDHRAIRSALFHPLLPGLQAKSHTVPNLLKRLHLADPIPGASVGLLLLGFDSPEQPLAADVQKMTDLSELREPHWRRETAHWVTNEERKQQVSIWLWVRDTQ